MKYSILILLSIIITGCSTLKSSYAPTKEILANANYGTQPQNHQAIIKEYLTNVLLDSESARYTKFSKPKKSWMSEFKGFENVKYYGWLVCLDINAKNAFGGYTGNTTYVTLLKDDQVIYHQEGLQRNIAYGAFEHFVECDY